MKRIFAIVIASLAVLSLSAQHAGGDVSLLTKYEENGAKYYDANGTRITDMLTFLKEQGWTLLRVRLFVDPSNASSDDKGQGVVQDLDYVKALGARIKSAGFKFMLDFHYSDSWADPVKQYTPAAWTELSDDELTQKIYDYTRDCLEQLVEAGATPDYIQTGNEISYGMLWGAEDASTSSLKKCYYYSDDNWDRFTTLLKSAGTACREVCPNAKIIIHTERVANITALENIYTRMNNNGVDYDIIGLSYYSYYHGYLSQLKSALTRVESSFPSKDIMIVEAGYYHAYQPSDISYDYSSTYEVSDDGQLAFTQALIEELKSHTQVKGLLWWWPEANEYGLDWNTKRVTDNWYNAGLWDNSTGRAMQSVAALGEYAHCNEITGDVNSDGAVDITDVNIIINVVTTNVDTTDGLADITGDGIIDITDVNAAINIVLNIANP